MNEKPTPIPAPVPIQFFAMQKGTRGLQLVKHGPVYIITAQDELTVSSTSTYWDRADILKLRNALNRELAGR